jgi:hypothetical protein
MALLRRSLIQTAIGPRRSRGLGVGDLRAVAAAGQMNGRDPTTILSIAALLGSVALAACVWPRTARHDAGSASRARRDYGLARPQGQPAGLRQPGRTRVAFGSRGEGMALPPREAQRTGPWPVRRITLRRGDRRPAGEAGRARHRRVREAAFGASSGGHRERGGWLGSPAVGTDRRPPAQRRPSTAGDSATVASGHSSPRGGGAGRATATAGKPFTLRQLTASWSAPHGAETAT